MSGDEKEQDLFWYAFNYRNASTTDADDWWKALDAFVNAMIAAKQAKIDDLMFEFCQDEMTDEQKENWAKHQKPAS